MSTALEKYERIYKWHRAKYDQIFSALSNRDKDDPYIRCYLELVEVLPSPDVASPEDIALICREVLSGLMEWAYVYKDEYGIAMNEYAHDILNDHYDGYHGDLTISSAEKSRLYEKYSCLNCMKRYR